MSWLSGGSQLGCARFESLLALLVYIYIYLFLYIYPNDGYRPVADCRRLSGSPSPSHDGSASSPALPSVVATSLAHRLHRRSGFGWPKPLREARPPPHLAQVTLNSLCSTHRHKGNSFCSTLYTVRALFVRSMWDIPQFVPFSSQLYTLIS